MQIENHSKERGRYFKGRQARLRAEVFHKLQNVPVNYSCVYLVKHQARQHKRGWDSVTYIDIQVAVEKVKAGKANLLPETEKALGIRN